MRILSSAESDSRDKFVPGEGRQFSRSDYASTSTFAIYRTEMTNKWAIQFLV
jgi:hypothetical protein